MASSRTMQYIPSGTFEDGLIPNRQITDLAISQTSYSLAGYAMIATL